MTEQTKNWIAIVFWLLVLLGFMIYFSRSEKVQAKVDQILFDHEPMYAMARTNMRGGQ